MDDRRVHAECVDFQVVRYERSGKWWVESKRFGVKPVQLNVRQAVEWARKAMTRRGGVIHLGVPGGSTFDRLAA